MGSTFAGDRGTVGTLGGGCASTTSARVKTVGGVSGSASGMGTGSGAGEHDFSRNEIGTCRVEM